MAKRNPSADALPLLAYKIAPRQFDVSYRFSNISLRDQIVRSQMLVRTLLEMDLVKANNEERDYEFQLLICGAGAAGLAAAKEAEARGISFVLIEKGNEVPGGVLSSPAQRYVSTGMYEWPHPNHKEHKFPLHAPGLLGYKSPISALPLQLTKPVPVKEFGNAISTLLMTEITTWQDNFKDCIHGNLGRKRSLLAVQTVLSTKTKGKLRALINHKVSIHGVPLNFAKLPSVQLDQTLYRTDKINFRFQYVIYAVGFAIEAVNYAKEKTPYPDYEHKSFWELDCIPESHLGFGKNPYVGILGSGDGALQDALRCLIRPDLLHPLAIWNELIGHKELLDSPDVHLAMAAVAAADGYTTAGGIWSAKTHIFEALDDAFRDIIKRLINCHEKKLLEAVDKLIRDDVQKVTIVNRDGHFSKAYALNRFLVLFFHEILQKKQSERHFGKLEILSGEVTQFKQIRPNVRGGNLIVQDGNGNTISRDFELVIIRGGLDQSTSPTQLVGLSGKDTGRAELGRIPPPIRPIGFR